MNVMELRNLIDGLDGDTEVRMMSQPSWPFEYSIAGTWQPPTENPNCDECGYPADSHEFDANDINDHAFESGDAFVPEGHPSSVVYLVEGTQLAYGTKRAFEEVERAW